MLLAADSNEFGLVIASGADAPAAAYGAAVTPGNNTYGAYTSLIAGASVTDDAYGITININSNDVSAAVRDAIVTIGLDPAGGTTFSDFISHLIASCAGPFAANGMGLWYYFPVFIKAGSSVGAKASVNNATVGTCNVAVWLDCKPSRPDLIRVGSAVETFGAVTASSTGTGITPGNTTKGAWSTSLGSPSKPCWWWQVGQGINNSAMSARVYFTDLGIGDASNKKVVVSNMASVHSTAEQQSNVVARRGHGGATTADLIYARAACTAAPASGISAIAYGVSG